LDASQDELVRYLEAQWGSAERSNEEDSLEDDRLEDDRLRLIFTCCDLSLAPEAHVALTLRDVCGLTTEEIAKAFLITSRTLAQRIVRAKAKIQETPIRYEVPTPLQLGSPTHDSQILLRHWFLLTSKVHLWRGPQHLPEHFNKGTHAVITNRNSRLRYRLALGKHFKSSEQPCLLPPTAKRHTYLRGKSTHESTAGHTSKMRPVVQPTVVANIIQQSMSNSGQPLVSGQGQTQRLLLRLRNLITKNCD
jgi:hypothetical protein